MIKRARGEFTAYVEDVDGNEHAVKVMYDGYSDDIVETVREGA